MTKIRLTFAILLALLGVAAPAHAALEVGIADQKADMFSDPRWTSLAITHVRIDVAWDALKDRGQGAALDAWMAAAQQAGADVLVTLDRSRRPGRSRLRPGTAALVQQFNRLRRRYPFVKEWATWNEANLSTKPEVVARWWSALHRACPSCTILAADLLDDPNLATWAKRFVKATKVKPRVWGLHNYLDANRFTTSGTRALLKAVPGDVWFTETGGVVKRRNNSKRRYTESAAHAAQATRFIFTKLVRVSPRIKRVYLYHWNASQSGKDSWDSGLIAPDGSERPAYEVLKTQLTKLRR